MALENGICFDQQPKIAKPNDLIVGVDGESEGDRRRAFIAAEQRFSSILDGLVSELDQHRRALRPETELPEDATAQRM